MSFLIFHLMIGLIFYLWLLLEQPIRSRAEHSKSLEWLLLPHFLMSAAYLLTMVIMHGVIFRSRIESVQHEWLQLALVLWPLLWLGLVAAFYQRRYKQAAKTNGL